jgi:hypothetical protein
VISKYCWDEIQDRSQQGSDGSNTILHPGNCPVETTPKTDSDCIHEDGLTYVEDLQSCGIVALGVVPNPRADVNGDGKVDTSDIQQIVTKILGG